MKKLTALFLSAVLLLSLAACGTSRKPTAMTERPEPTTSKQAPTEEPSTERPAESTAALPTETEPQGGKTLVVYFSASGNTERVAQEIAVATDGDLFEIVQTVKKVRNRQNRFTFLRKLDAELQYK